MRKENTDIKSYREEFMTVLSKLNEKAPALSIDKPFPPIPRPYGRYVVKASVEYRMKRWKHYSATNDDLLLALKDVLAQIDSKK